MSNDLNPADSLVSLQDVNNYFYCDADEACKEMTGLFVERMLETGFDSSVDLKLRGELVLWALTDPGYEAGEKADKIMERLKGGFILT